MNHIAKTYAKVTAYCGYVKNDYDIGICIIGLTTDIARDIVLCKKCLQSLICCAKIKLKEV